MGRQVSRSARSTFRGTRQFADRGERSLEESLARLRAVARALIQAGAIDAATAESIVSGLRQPWSRGPC
jgi:hypothetical protein